MPESSAQPIAPPRSDVGSEWVPPELEARLRTGDAEALALIFAACRERLLQIVEFRLDDRISARLDAADVLQEAYMAAAARIQHYPGSSYTSPFLWLRAILSQTLVDLYRRHVGAQRRDSGREVSLDAIIPANTASSLAFQLAGTATTPGEAMARADMRTTLEAAIAGMEPLDREILALRHFEELSNSEAAEVLNIEQKAASIRYVRALRRLRTLLTEMSQYFQAPSTAPA